MKKTLVKVLALNICAIMLFSLSSFAFADDGSLITRRTEDFVLGVGETTTISVEAASETSFEWEISTDGGVNWSAAPGAPDATNAATYSITTAQANTPARQPYLYRVTVKKGSEQTESAVISVLVSNDYTYKPVSLRGGDVELIGYIYNNARLEVTPLTVGSAEETKLRSALSSSSLPLIACSPSLTNRDSQYAPYFGELTVTLHVGVAYDGQTLQLHQLIGDKVSSYSGTVSDGKLSINVSALSPFMVEVPADDNTKTITVSAGTGGSVTPSGEVNVGNGASRTFTFLPDAGYAVNKVTLDGAEVSFTGNSYKLDSIAADHTVNVSFRRVTPSNSFHTVAISCSAHGEVSPTGSLMVRHGGAQTVYFYPESGYELDEVLIDGAAVSVIGNSYTLTAVEADTTVRATFKSATSQPPDVAKTINSSAGAKGSIYPSGDTSVEYGGGMYYYFAPEAGYVVDAVTVDGAAVSVTGNCYHFSDVTADHSVSVTFKKKPMPNYPGDTVYDTTEGENGIWSQGSAKEYTFKFSGLLSRFSGLRIDGKLVDKSNYTAESGSTIITLKPEYLKTLSVGSHTLRALYTDGYAQTAFTVAAWVNPFADVKKNDWFYEDVAYANIAGLMEGTTDATFAPDAGASRAMIVTILWRLENKPTMGAGKSGTFVDVPENEWYTEAVEWAAANGLVEGFEDSSFRPTIEISREQLAAILWRYAKYKKYDVSVGEDTNILSYTDAESISEYAVPAVQWACGAGLMQGDAGALMPQRGANRAQVAAMLHRFCERVK